MDDILTIKEAAALLKLDKRTVAKLAIAGKIPAKKLGGSWRFSRLSLEQLFQTPVRRHRRPIAPPEVANG